jgi:hypothetical protein
MTGTTLAPRRTSSPSLTAGLAYRPAPVTVCVCGDLLGVLDGGLVHVGCADCPDGVSGPCAYGPHIGCALPEAAACAHQQPFCGDAALDGPCQQGFGECCGCCDPWRACTDL